MRIAQIPNKKLTVKKVNSLSIARDAKEVKKYRWQVSLTVLMLFIFGALINIPFSREVKRLNIEAGNTGINLKQSIYADISAVGMSSLILGVLLVFIGLWVSSRAQMGAPMIARFFSKKPMGEIVSRDAILSSFLLVVLVSVVLLGLFEIQKGFYPVPHKMARPSKPFYALVSLSAGITEEIMFRLGLMSLIVTVLLFIRQAEEPSNKIVWISILISAVFFGLIHLPLSKNFVALTPFTISVTMIGNLITGSVFGWIFWKRGLLVAILSHTIFDLVFHVVGTPYA